MVCGLMRSASRGRRSSVSTLAFFNCLVYHNGLLSFLQRCLSLMGEEESFWALIGMVKAFSNIYTFDFKEIDNNKNQITPQEIKLIQY